MSETKKVKLFSYCRVSTVGQANEGDSLDFQKSEIEKYCKTNNYELVETFIECASGGKSFLKRKKLAEIMERLEKGEADGLIIYKIDRLSRSIKDFLTIIDLFKEKGYSFFEIKNNLSLSKSATSNFVIQLLALIGDLEKEMIRERTKEILSFKKANNECLGKVPFGKNIMVIEHEGKKIKKLVDNNEELRVVKYIVEQVNLGKKYYELGKILTKKKIKNKKGIPYWEYSQVCNLYKRYKDTDLSAINAIDI